MTANVDKEGYEDPKSHEEILAEAKAFFEEDYGYENQVRLQMERDLRFSLGLDHWKDEAYNARSIDKRPTLVIPRMDEFLNKVKNEQRQNKPSIKVSARGAKSEDIQKKRVKAAKNRQGLIRFIQYDTDATEAYQIAFDSAVDIGRGWFRINTDYVGSDSFDQKIVIESIPNSFSVVPDKNRQKKDYSDMKRCFVTSKIARERFKAEWPDADPNHWTWAGSPDNWMTQDEVTVAEYYCIRYRHRTLLGMENGENFYEDELKDIDQSEADEIRQSAIQKRDVKEPYVKWYKMTGMEILEEKDVLGKFIPVIPVIATEQVVAGTLIINGMVRKIRDSQMLYNFWASTEAELLTMAPKAPYIAAAGQIEDYKKYWESANSRSWAYLPYKSISTGGRPVPPPQRVPFAGPPVGIITAKQGTIDDMRAITGIHAPSLGMSGAEKSGRAIIAQQRMGDTATYHYTDGMGTGITHAGRIINSWLPDIYDTNRIEKILGEDGDESTIEIGGQDKDGETVELGSGEFDVVVTMGPSHTTKRQEAAESMLAFMKAVPNVVPLIYDLMVKNMDWPGAQEIADRLRKTIPPQILEEQGGEQQMAQMIQQLTQQVQQYEQVLPALQQQLEAAMKGLEDEGKEIVKDLEIARLKSGTDLQVAQIKAGTEREKNFQTVLREARTPAPTGATQE